VIDATWLQPGTWFDTATLLVSLQRLDAAWRKKHARWLREMDAFGVYFSAAAKAAEFSKGLQERERLLDRIGAAKAKKLEDELVEFMESLPRRYTFEFPIQTPVPFGAPEIKLSKTLALVEVQRSAPATAGSLGGLMAGLGNLPAETTQVTTITALRVHAVGYFDDSDEDSAAQYALSALRQFASLAYADGMMHDDWRTDASAHSNEAQVLDICNASAQAKSLALPDATVRLLRRRKLSKALFGKSSRGVRGDLAKALLQQPVPERERAVAVKENLAVIARVLSAPQRDAKHLRTGAEWLFDSQSETNETTALLFAAIGLEAVLDSPPIEVTARLGDRVAYLLGQGQTQRKQIAEAYAKFYRVRSALVHGRERTLDADGRSQTHWGQQILRSVLAKDLEQWPLPGPKVGKKARKA
jgi:Apea-like HEPN